MKKLNYTKVLSFFMLLGFTACFNSNQQTTSDKTDWQTPFEKDPEKNTTATYTEAIAYYKDLAMHHRQLRVLEYGQTDIGEPLHLAVLSKDGIFDPERAQEANKTILMVNNAIHPGEPCGVDASMMLTRDYLRNDSLQTHLDNIIIIIIPFYNIGGGLNRGGFSRANQDGPHEHGFRGNARNLDLNRDFVKCDSRNAKVFTQIFREWQPHIFMDNHTTNGADYQHVMTLISTQKDKLHTNLSQYLTSELEPALYSYMEDKKYPMSPYVYASSTPDKGIRGFLDLPRYSSGYTTLFNVIGFIPEAHMLKPYGDRVQSTYHLMDGMIQYCNKNYNKIIEIKKQTDEIVATQDSFEINWKLDDSAVDSVLFHGYEPDYKTSAVTGKERLFYDKNKKYTKNIPFYNTYKTTQKVKRPKAYIVPQAWREVLERLQLNQIEMQPLQKDTTINAGVYYIKKTNSPKNPYEGHYLHTGTEVEYRKEEVHLRGGDFVIKANQPSNRFIIETLEPQAPDSYFAWNFFDAILQQKEYFSSYVFEETALELLKNDPKLRADFEEKKKTDKAFAENDRAQLDFIYKRSPYYEWTHNRYPVVRVE